MLSDNIVLSIMARVNTTTAARTSVLSTLWKHLPWLLCELTIDVKDFFTYPGWAASLRSVCFKKKNCGLHLFLDLRTKPFVVVASLNFCRSDLNFPCK